MFPTHSHTPSFLSRAWRVGRTLVRARLLGRNVPLFVTWKLTFRCTQRCAYCGAWQLDFPELETGQVLSLIDRLYEFGMRWVNFTGGEPLLRDDIGEILSHAARRGAAVYLSSNGVPVSGKADHIRAVSRMILSLDGPRDVNEQSRGKGTYDRVMEAADVCRQKSVPLILLCVLNRWNLGAVDEILRTARGLRVNVMFQPAIWTQIYSDTRNPIAPPVDAYRKTVRYLIRRKQEGAPIANSVPGLRHLARWPDNARLWCAAGRIACGVEPDGTLVACDRVQRDFLNRPDEDGLMENLPSPVGGCNQCWCAPLVELALVFSLRPSAVINAWRIASG